MKLGPVAKLDKRNKTTSKTDDEVISTNCDVILNFALYGQFGSGLIVCKIYMFVNDNVLS